MIKQAWSDFSFFFFKLFQILVSKESSYFFITSGKVDSWNMFHLEDINEHVANYGYHD